jgi:phosphoglycerate dehydrogenase-like enzyme
MRIALWDIAAAQKEGLRGLLAPSDELLVGEAALAANLDVDVLIASRFSAEQAANIHFKLLQVPGAGLDRIDLAAVPKSAWVCNAYEHEAPISEYVMAAVLDHMVEFAAMVRRMPEQGWGRAYFGRKPHGEVAGKTIGLIGFGHIGQAIARRAKAFDLRVLAVAARPRASAPDVDWFGTAGDLPKLLRESDFVVVACALNDSTRGMIGPAELALLKPTALLINVGRAEVVDEQALYEALEGKRIAGAVLDTWYQYPANGEDKTAPSRFPLLALPNVSSTPHSSAWTQGVWDRRVAAFAENVRRLAEGAPLLNVVQRPEK